MNLEDMAFQFNVTAKNYDEKAAIVRAVANELGRQGIMDLSNLTGHTPEDLTKYGVLGPFFEDQNRRRRQRKPKTRIIAGDLIEKEIGIIFDKKSIGLVRN